jgi:hypothetical protein
MLISLLVVLPSLISWRHIFTIDFRQFPKCFCYAQKGCARGDTTPLTMVKSNYYYIFTIANLLDYFILRYFSVYLSLCLPDFGYKVHGFKFS